MGQERNDAGTLWICPSDSHPSGGFPVSDFGLRNADSIKQEEDKINTEGFLSVVRCCRRKAQSEKADCAFNLCPVPHAQLCLTPFTYTIDKSDFLSEM
jgi:hypothetical protein